LLSGRIIMFMIFDIVPVGSNKRLKLTLVASLVNVHHLSVGAGQVDPVSVSCV